MKDAIPKSKGGKRPGAGRPATGRDPVMTLRLPQQIIHDLEHWAKASGITRSHAARIMIENGLLKKPRKLS